jgi:hypothetical protein
MTQEAPPVKKVVSESAFFCAALGVTLLLQVVGTLLLIRDRLTREA